MQNGIGIVEFGKIHTLPDCRIESELLEVLAGKGPIYLDIDPAYDYKAPMYIYRDKCEKHGVVSASYKLLTPQ